MMKKNLLTLFVSLALTAAALPFTSSPAGAVELCAALDGSGSVTYPTDEDFKLQLDGLASAVADPAIIPADGSVILTVVVFGMRSIVELSAELIDSPARAGELAGMIGGIPTPDFWGFGHGTDLAAAIGTCMDNFQDPSDEWIIDISSDGEHNYPYGTDIAYVLPVRYEAVQQGLDVLNAIGLSEASVDDLKTLVWPQPVSAPPAPGFLIEVPYAADYVEAMRDKVRSEVFLSVALDLKPRSCPNSFNREKAGVLPVAILGGPNLAVLEIDPSSLLLEGVAPLRWSYEDAAAPASGPGPEDSCLDCSEAGPDGFTDLTLKFDAEEIAALLAREGAGDCLLLTVTGSLKEEYGGRNLRGDDTLRVVR
jgi:hypothetical protein